VEAHRFIVIEDNPDDRLLIARELQRSFPSVEIAVVRNDGEFQAELNGFNFDLVITDFQLQWTNGIEVVKRVKGIDPYVPMIMFTGSGSQEIAVEAMRAGLDDYLLKGQGHFVRLPAAVRACLAHAAIRRNAADLQSALQESEARYHDLARERAELLAKSEEVSRLKDEFLATVSHELRTPLTSIVGWIKLMKAKALPENQVETAMASIERNSESLLHTVSDLLDMTALVSGGFQLRRETVDLTEIVRDAFHAIRPAAESKGIQLEFVETRGVDVSADRARLHQALLNLLSNAVKFTDHNGSISVRCSSVNNRVTIELTDTGIGIDPKFLPHVFDRFRQADASFGRKEGGLGLGLAIVREIVQKHNGSIEVRSNGHGEGATFTLTLPARADLSAA